MSKLIKIDDSVKERPNSILVRNEEDFVQLCTIESITLSEDSKYYEVTVSNESGATLSSRFYLPKEENEYENEQKFKAAETIFIRNATNLLRRFEGQNSTIQAVDYVDLINKVITKITPKLKTKKVYTLFELTKNDRGIFTRISGIAPFADTSKELVIPRKQKELLKELMDSKNVTPDSDDQFMQSPKENPGF